jgi:phosphoglycerate kinase
MNKLSIDDVELKNKRILVRVDFNLPLDKNGGITDNTRIVASLPTIKKILKTGGKAILMSHLGRPKGKRSPEFSLRPCAKRLGDLLGQPVKFVEDCIGPEVEAAVAELQPGECLLLENLRFYAEEEKNDADFSRKLAALADLYVNDAFGSAHRAHASTEGITRHLKRSVAGYLMQKEIDYLSRALTDPARPFVAILGGAKISEKLLVIENLLHKADATLIGGGMAFTLIKAQGGSIGSSLLEEDRIDYCRNLLSQVKTKNQRLILPVDCVVADYPESSKKEVVAIQSIPDDKKGLDIGPRTVYLFGREIEKAKTIVWNGPLGMFENEAFANGTKAVARQIANVTEQGATSIIGGGDTAAAVAKLGLDDKMSHISTGGGASLEFLEGKILPGIAALSEKKPEAKLA